SDLGLGTHTAEVTGTDRYGREFTETIRFTVVEDEAAAQSESQKLLRQDGFDTQQTKESREPKGLDSDEAQSARNDSLETALRETAAWPAGSRAPAPGSQRG